MSDRDEQNQQVEISDNVSISLAAFIGVYVSKGQQDVATTILNAIIDQVSTRRAAEARVEEIDALYARADHDPELRNKLDELYKMRYVNMGGGNVFTLERLSKLQPTKGSKNE